MATTVGKIVFNHADHEGDRLELVTFGGGESQAHVAFEINEAVCVFLRPDKAREVVACLQESLRIFGRVLSLISWLDVLEEEARR